MLDQFGAVMAMLMEIEGTRNTTSAKLLEMDDVSQFCTTKWGQFPGWNELCHRLLKEVRNIENI